jgi:hypothetical protein
MPQKGDVTMSVVLQINYAPGAPAPTIIEATMMKSDDLKLTQYAPARRSIKFVTRPQHGSFRLRYAAVVAMAFVFSGLAPAVLMALIWHETGLSPKVFAGTIATLAIATLAAWLIYSIDAAKACSLPLGRRRFPDVD